MKEYLPENNHPLHQAAKKHLINPPQDQLYALMLLWEYLEEKGEEAPVDDLETMQQKVANMFDMMVPEEAHELLTVPVEEDTLNLPEPEELKKMSKEELQEMLAQNLEVQLIEMDVGYDPSPSWEWRIPRR